jgi:hypothetical protein
MKPFSPNRSGGAVLSLLLFTLLACNNKGKPDIPAKDTTAATPTDSLPPQRSGVNNLLSGQPGQWHVMTDAETGWTQDALEYFVYPQRKTDPDYPFITRGDYNCDGQPDMAALVTDSSRLVRLIFIYHDNKTAWWPEDMQGAALKNMKKQDFGAMKDEEEVRVSLPCDAVEAEWYEKATQVIYWDGKTFKNVWTGD